MRALAIALLAGAALAAVPHARAQDEPTVRITGLLLDGSGAPAARVAIGVCDAVDPDSAATLATPIATTGTDGVLAVEIPGSTRNRVLVIGGKPFATMQRTLGASERVVELGTVALAPGVTGIGRVRDADGRPLAGAVVDCRDLLDSRTFLSNQRTHVRLRCRVVAKSGDDGIFRLPGMMCSVGEVRVRCQGFCDVSVAPVAAGTPLDVTLQPARTVRGRVLGPDGAAMAGVTVRAGVASATTADDGSFVLPLRDRHTEFAYATLRGSGGSLQARSQLPVDDQPLELRLASDPAEHAGTVRVRAVDADGVPVEAFDAWIAWERRDQLEFHTDAMLFLGTGISDGTHATAADGQASLRGPTQARDDVGIVFVHAPGHGLGRVEISRTVIAAEPVVVTLPRPGVLRGKVVDGSGAPLAGAQVVASQNVSDQMLRHLQTEFFQIRSMLEAPTKTTTGTDGTWSLADLPPGDVHVFLHLPGRVLLPPLRVDLPAGGTIDGLTFTVPDNRTMRGRLLGAAPDGARVRVHWHRPNMSSSLWPFELDGSVSVAADGTFALSDLPPRLYRLELLVPAPPRGNPPYKLVCGEWDGGNASDEAVRFPVPEIARVVGRIAGEVPWNRLAVLATWQDEDGRFDEDFAPRGPLTLVGQDRSFSMLLPARNVRLLLLDPFSGIVLAWTDVTAADLSKQVTFAGVAAPLTVRLTDDVEGAQRPMTLQYVPTDDYWPLRAQGPFASGTRTGMRTEVRSGSDVLLWLPAPSGEIELQGNGTRLQLDVGSIDGDVVEIATGPKRLQVR